jgi:hypothetical protein
MDASERTSLAQRSKHRRVSVFGMASMAKVFEMLYGGNGFGGDVAGERDRVCVCFSGRTRACCVISSLFMMASIHLTSPGMFFLSDRGTLQAVERLHSHPTRM